MSITNILVPVDFSEASSVAIRVADRLARGCGAKLTLLHAEAFEAPAYFTSDQVSGLAAERRSRQDQAEKYLAAFGRRFTNIDFSVRVVMRPAFEAIVDAAVGVDLVVLGTHARKGPRRWWLGSVAERVLRELTSPVLVVHGADAGSAALDRIAVHAPPGLQGTNAMALAAKLGVALTAPVHDRRTTATPVGRWFDDVSLVVVAEPEPHDRAWRTSVGEPLIRVGKGPVLFVPEEAK